MGTAYDAKLADNHRKIKASHLKPCIQMKSKLPQPSKSLNFYQANGQIPDEVAENDAADIGEIIYNPQGQNSYEMRN